MAKKFEIVGQSLVITDESVPKVLFDFPKGEVYYDSTLLIEEGVIKIDNMDALDNAVASAPRVLLTDSVDVNGTPFTISSFISFARANLGFKTASGGSGAVNSVNSKTGVVTLNTNEVPETTEKVYVTPEEKNTLNALSEGLLTNSSTIVASRNLLATDKDGINNCTADTDVTITLLNNATVPLEVGTLIQYKRSGDGNVIVSGSGLIATRQTQALDDVITIRKTATDTWEYLNPPKAGNTIDSVTTGEPTGSNRINNIVWISQANYDAAVSASTIVSTTLYIING